MASTRSGGQALSLHDAARQMGVHFNKEHKPADGFIVVNGMNFHYLEWGDDTNPDVLLLHGASQQAHSWDFVSLSLADKYHVLAWDQRGHGDTDWAPEGDYSIEAHQRDLDGFVQVCGMDSFVLIGHSMGGRNSYIWTSRHPGCLKGLVIVTRARDSARGTK